MVSTSRLEKHQERLTPGWPHIRGHSACHPPAHRGCAWGIQVSTPDKSRFSITAASSIAIFPSCSNCYKHYIEPESSQLVPLEQGRALGSVSATRNPRASGRPRQPVCLASLSAVLICLLLILRSCKQHHGRAQSSHCI